jgi:hypothetical protein
LVWPDGYDKKAVLERYAAASKANNEVVHAAMASALHFEGQLTLHKYLEIYMANIMGDRSRDLPANQVVAAADESGDAPKVTFAVEIGQESMLETESNKRKTPAILLDVLSETGGAALGGVPLVAMKVWLDPKTKQVCFEGRGFFWTASSLEMKGYRDFVKWPSKQPGKLMRRGFRMWNAVVQAAKVAAAAVNVNPEFKITIVDAWSGARLSPHWAQYGPFADVGAEKARKMLEDRDGKWGRQIGAELTSDVIAALAGCYRRYKDGVVGEGLAEMANLYHDLVSTRFGEKFLEVKWRKRFSIYDIVRHNAAVEPSEAIATATVF